MITPGKAPAVSVVMPVYNGAAFLREAISSILNQTFTGFEFLIANDCSTDNSKNIIQSFHDPRINLICNKVNLGPGETLNKAISQANGPYIAVMHADDISLPHRLETQVTFMNDHPHIGVCGSLIKVFGLQDQGCIYETDSDAIKSMTLFRAALAHPTVIMRKNLFADGGVRYNGAFRYTEDYDLWRRLLPRTDFANIPEVLLSYRVHHDQATTKHNAAQQAEARQIRLRQLNDLGINPTEEETELHQTLSNGTLFSSRDFITATTNWFKKLEEANTRRGRYPKNAFSKLLSEFCSKHMWLIK